MSLESFVDGYIECALWSSVDMSADSDGEPSGSPLDATHGREDIAESAMAVILEDCQSFYQDNAPFWHAEGMEDSQAGHDFWLTRNHHGAGFWDRGIGANGDILTKASDPYGDCELWLGDDGRIYVQ